MEKDKQGDILSERWLSRFLGQWLEYIDDIILVLVALGIMTLAIILLIESFSDFYYFESHSIPHIISELMFVLILMELFRQVVRQLKRHSFSLSPFFFIGVIASIRGILLVQMRLAIGGGDVWTELLQIGIYAVVVLIMAISYYFSSKVEKKSYD